MEIHLDVHLFFLSKFRLANINSVTKCHWKYLETWTITLSPLMKIHINVHLFFFSKFQLDYVIQRVKFTPIIPCYILFLDFPAASANWFRESLDSFFFFFPFILLEVISLLMIDEPSK